MQCFNSVLKQTDTSGLFSGTFCCISTISNITSCSYYSPDKKGSFPFYMLGLCLKFTHICSRWTQSYYKRKSFHILLLLSMFVLLIGGSIKTNPAISCYQKKSYSSTFFLSNYNIWPENVDQIPKHLTPAPNFYSLLFHNVSFLLIM